MTTPVYICTGFLDSGKTTFIKDTLMKQEWIEEGPTLLLQCEEGEEEYSEKYLDENGLFLFNIEEREKLNKTFFENCEKIYHPVQVIIEYNGTWDLQEILDEDFPRNWEIQGVYSTVSGETLDMYLKNMRNMLMNQLTESELIIINRCGENRDRSAFRRALKIQNPQAQLIFEGVDGNIIPQTEEDLPYDLKADHIFIDDVDFGTWYVDAYEHPERYEHKKITFLAQLFRPKGMPANMLIPGRQIMTCCADDTTFLGYVCRSDYAPHIKEGSWVEVTAKVAFENRTEYQGEGIVLYASDVKECEPLKEEMVYFN